MMINNNTILIEVQGSIAYIWLNRPEVHNALNSDMITEFLMKFRTLNQDPAIRIIVIRGKGSSFCSGADLNWMRRSADLTDEENLNECTSVAAFFYEIFSSRKITLSLVHGPVVGGGIGLIAACDLAFAADSVEFALSEVRVGLIPATIAPYVIRKTGYAKAGELMLTGKKFTATEAEQFGLINKVWPFDTFDSFIPQVINEILQGAPGAQETMKAHMNSINVFNINKPLVESSARLIAEIRVAPEAREGINAFREKRKPFWYQN